MSAAGPSSAPPEAAPAAPPAPAPAPAQAADAGAGPSSGAEAPPAADAAAAGPSAAAAAEEDLGAGPVAPDWSAPAARPPAPWGPADDALLKEFYQEVTEVSRENEVMRILSCFKLNPFEHLSLRFDCTPEDIKKAFRKVSLLVHPDKCKHARAREAFDALGKAQEYLLDDGQRAALLRTLENVRSQLRAEWRKAHKHDVLTALAAAAHDKGIEGVLEEYEASPEFHEAWKLRAQKLLAELEWKRRKMTLRIQDEEGRVKELIDEEKAARKRVREHEANWEATRDTRVGSWRDFQKGQSGGGKKGKLPGEIKPPKQKTADATHSYIQRPVGQAPNQGAKPKGPVRAFRGDSAAGGAAGGASGGT